VGVRVAATEENFGARLANDDAPVGAFDARAVVAPVDDHGDRPGALVEVEARRGCALRSRVERGGAAGLARGEGVARREGRSTGGRIGLEHPEARLIVLRRVDIDPRATNVLLGWAATRNVRIGRIGILTVDRAVAVRVARQRAGAEIDLVA